MTDLRQKCDRRRGTVLTEIIALTFDLIFSCFHNAELSHRCDSFAQGVPALLSKEFLPFDPSRCPWTFGRVPLEIPLGSTRRAAVVEEKNPTLQLIATAVPAAASLPPPKCPPLWHR